MPLSLHKPPIYITLRSVSCPLHDVKGPIVCTTSVLDDTFPIFSSYFQTTQTNLISW